MSVGFLTRVKMVQHVLTQREVITAPVNRDTPGKTVTSVRFSLDISESGSFLTPSHLKVYISFQSLQSGATCKIIAIFLIGKT